MVLANSPVTRLISAAFEDGKTLTERCRTAFPGRREASA